MVTKITNAVEVLLLLAKALTNVNKKTYCRVLQKMLFITTELNYL